jgi:hypothetical protein
LKLPRSKPTEPIDYADLSTFKDDLPWDLPVKRVSSSKSKSKGRAPPKRTFLEILESPAVAAFFSADVVSVANPPAINDGGKIMDELTKLLAAVKQANEAQAAMAQALEAFSKRVGLVDTLAAFPDPPLEERGTPPPTVGALRIALSGAAERHGKDAIKAIVLAEADGKPIGEMSEDQRLMVLIALNAADALKAAHG